MTLLSVNTTGGKANISEWPSRPDDTHFLEDKGHFYSRNLLLIILQQYGERDSEKTVLLKTITTNVKTRKHSLVNIFFHSWLTERWLQRGCHTRYLVLAPSPHGSSSVPRPARRRRPWAQSGRGSGSSSCLQERGPQPLSVQTGFSEQWISTVEMGRIFICTKITGNEFLFPKRCPYVIGSHIRVDG